MRVGIICEGSTDYVVLQAIVAEVLRRYDPTFSLLQPDFDALARPRERRPATGWQAVRAFLQAGNVQLTPLDLVVVQVDASIRHLGPVASLVEDDGLEALCDLVKRWIGAPVPPSAIIALPREETESWLVAAHTRRKRIEDIADPAEVLVSAELLRPRRGKPDKSSERYRELTVALRQQLSRPRWLATVPELERFCNKIRAHGRRR